MISARSLEWKFLEQTLYLLPQKALFWKEENSLIVSDLHIGKVGHFRKAGIAIPRNLEQEDLSKLSDLIHEWKPYRVIFLGDLFHSDMNSDWHWLQLWRDLFPHIEMILVKGNHDILNPEFYEEAGFIVTDRLVTSTFAFIHEPLSAGQLNLEEKYVLSGHLHPGVKLVGSARQNLTISCFYFGVKQAVLPAFGRFTGNFCVEVEDSSLVFGIVNEKVIEL
ncbi:ligase-associated DNA damage response endonuclease PdeM [Desertivirga arenae]|uniref:ligase-associated DNA damage response endonuclease PdeM n=1 Tax=Desertivirga arenae TaxID=2810309 RepID=UPI001A97AD18|nr:ligase-associated DNA damage response endonuclease PdeM [Pedobacter sp. SYSU D00823]